MEIGGKTATQLEREMEEAKINITSYAKDMLHSKDFTTLSDAKTIETVRLRVEDLGFDRGATTAEIMGTKDDVDKHGNPAPFSKGKVTELGLELCPAEVGPHYRLQYQDQPLDEWFYVGMKQITDSNGLPKVFYLERNDHGLWLDDYWAYPAHRWDPDYEFVFSLRKVVPDTQNPQKLGLLERFFRR